MDGQRYAPAALSSAKDPVPIVVKAGPTPGPIWKGAENLAETKIGNYRVKSQSRAASTKSRSFQCSTRIKVFTNVQFQALFLQLHTLMNFTALVHLS